MQTFDALLEASQLEFIIAKGYPIGSARAKDTRWNLEKPHTGFGTLSPSDEGTHACAPFASYKQRSDMCAMILLREAHLNSASKVFLRDMLGRGCISA